MVIVNCLYHLVSGSFCMHVDEWIICSINLLLGENDVFLRGEFNFIIRQTNSELKNSPDS